MADYDDEPMEVEAVVADEDDEEDDDDDEEAIVEAAPVEVVAAEDDDDDSESEAAEEEVVVAAMVLPEEDAVVEEVAAVVEAPAAAAAPAPAKKATPKKKKAAPKKKAADKKDTKQTASVASKKKKKKSSSAGSSSKPSGAATVTEVWPVNAARVDFAKEARSLLHDTVQHLPVVLAETQVRSLGQLKLKAPNTATPFCTTSALYPVGFSCDRFEFSPVHGRLIQLRCTILDAARVRQLQKDRQATNLWPHADGPIFRVMWGLGVDEEKWADSTQIPFQVQPPMGGPQTRLSPIKPLIDQRVRVRFEKKEYYNGVITAVGNAGKNFKISIKYDDGSVEKDTPFPDPDISLLTPGKKTRFF